MPDIIEFNAGGQIFASTYETVGFDKKSALYSWYIERKGAAHLVRDKKGRFFIDRDPASFGIILNFLRLQSAKQLWEVCLPKDPDRLALLTQEAEFFRLPLLRDQAIALLHKWTVEDGTNAEQQRGYPTTASNSSEVKNGGTTRRKKMVMGMMNGGGGGGRDERKAGEEEEEDGDGDDERRRRWREG